MASASDFPAGLTASEPPLPVTKVLVVDADEQLRASLRQFLGSHGFLVFEADSAPAARDRMASVTPDVIILDVLVPGEDGLSIARELSLRPELSVIMLSELASEVDRIVGLEAGADDYLAKPVSLRELLARVRAVRRRSAKAKRGDDKGGGHAYLFAGWRLDIDRRVLADPTGLPLQLSDGEFALLRTFVERPQRVLTRDQLLDFARGPDSEAYDRAIDTQVSRLRRKLLSRSDGDLIRTVRSEGYMFTARVEAAR